MQKKNHIKHIHITRNNERYAYVYVLEVNRYHRKPDEKKKEETQKRV